jgi:hypothetical protein
MNLKKENSSKEVDGVRPTVLPQIPDDHQLSGHDCGQLPQGHHGQHKQQLLPQTGRQGPKLLAKPFMRN